MNIEDLLNSPSLFSMYIEREAKRNKTTLLDIIVNVCDQHNIEYESINKMISKALREKIELEAMQLNLLTTKKSSGNIFEQFT